MNEKFELKSLWWLPTHPRDRVRGTLHFDPLQGATVDLFGRLPDLPADSGASNSLFWRADIVLGHAANGEPMTLLYCHESSSTYSVHVFASDRFPTKKISASVLIKGQHFENKTDILFKKLSFQFSRAQDWADITQVHAKKDDRTATLAYTRPETLEMRLPGDLALSLDYGLSVHQGFEGASMTKFLSWIVEADAEKTFDEWWKIQYLLGAFLTLATRHTVHLTQVHQTIEVPVEMPDGTTGKTYHKTELFWDVPEQGEEDDTSGGRDMLFLLRDLGQGEAQKASLEKCLRCWFEKAERLEAICELYVGTIHNRRLYPIHRFSNLIQALESYHRGASNRDITLKSRLEELVATYESVVIRSFAKRAEFIQKVLDTRNYLTHYDPSKKARAARGQELYDLSQSLQLMVEMSLLRELEVDSARVTHILTRDRRRQGWLEKSLEMGG